MDKQAEVLTKNLRQKIYEKFHVQGINVMPSETQEGFHMKYRDVDYSFSFENIGGNMMFTIGVKPLNSDAGGLEHILSRVREQLPSNKQFEKSKYFANYILSANGEHFNFSCRVKKVLKTEQDENLFRDMIWGEVIQRIMRGVYYMSEK